MSTITSGNFAKALWPGVNKFFGQAYTERPVQWSSLFESYSSRQAWEEDVFTTWFGLAPVKTEGASVTYDSARQGWTTRYRHVVRALGFKISKEAVTDDLYDVVASKKAKALAFSMRSTKEIVAANVYNRAFNSSYVGGDGKELLATDHPNVTGGTWQNELTNAADLSEASLEQACIDIAGWTNDRGLQIAIMPKTLIIPKELMFEAERILKSPYRVGTADNDVNALYTMGKFPGGVVVNYYLTDADAWFLRTDAQDGMKHFQRWPLNFAVDNDFGTSNASYKADERYVFGWTDPRGLYGSPGA